MALKVPKEIQTQAVSCTIVPPGPAVPASTRMEARSTPAWRMAMRLETNTSMPHVKRKPVRLLRAACVDSRQTVSGSLFTFSLAPSRARCPYRTADRYASIDGRVGAQIESSSLTSFDGFGLNDTITRTIAEEEHATSTPIQAPTVPVVMSRRDVIVMRLMNSPATSSKRLARRNELQGHRKEADNVQDS